MRKKIVKTILAMTLIASTTTSLCGCGTSTFVSNNVEDYPLVNALTEYELIDYYAKALEYDTIVSRNVEEDRTVYVKKDIDGAKAERLKELVAQAESILATDDFEYTKENLDIMSEDSYNYVKALLDNYYLTESNILTIQGALGYYFVDVQYKLNPRELGTFNQCTPLIGLDGAFRTTYDDNYELDMPYMITVTKKLNEYFIDERIMKAATIDIQTGEFNIIDNADPKEALKALMLTQNDSYVIGNTISNTVTVSPEETENTTETEGETTEDVLLDDSGNVIDADGNIVMSAEDYQNSLTENTEEVEEPSGGMDYDTIVSEDRTITLDTDLINRVAGISLKQKAFLPELDLVYQKPENQGTFGGYGIYSAGGNGMKVFGFDREKLDGTITLTYVFKDAVDGTDKILGSNIYVKEEDVTTGFNVSSEALIIPDFLHEQFEIIVDRSDRLLANGDLSGLMSGNVYQDMGFAVLRGYKDINTNTLKYLSTIRQVIARDYATNSYLLEVETTTQEGEKTSDVYGTYRDRYYMVVQQQGTEFAIVDSIRMSRTMVEEPAINPDDAILKRLVALNLAGDVDENAQGNVNKLLSDWYTACSNRLLYARDSEGNLKTIVIDGVEKQFERGMYDCFQTDVTMLKSKDLEYMQSSVRAILDKHGTSTGVMFNGTVTSWIGGAENQVEFTTEELVTYAGRTDAHYMQVYYLVSNMNDTWVIDERTVIDEREVEGTEANNIKERLQ